MLDPDVIVTDTEDGLAAHIVSQIPEDAPELVREGIARRRIVLQGGTCPCGAAFTMPSRQQRRAAQRRGEPIQVSIWHAESCPAGDTILLPAIRAWQEGGE
jgi:hypothetical protein